MLGGIEVFVFLMSGQLGKGKEEGVAPSSSGLLEADQEGCFEFSFSFFSFVISGSER